MLDRGTDKRGRVADARKKIRGQLADQFRLEPGAYDHPDAIALTEQAQRYYVSIYGGPDSDPLGAADFAPPHGAFLLGYWDDEPAAMGGWHRCPGDSAFPGRRVGQIRRMFVRPDLRGRGLGRRLLRQLEERAVAGGVDLLVLASGRPQTEAIRLYRAAGYLDVPAFGYYADESEAVHLGKRLTRDLL